jgi:putative RNA 2'-phosphotransferase
LLDDIVKTNNKQRYEYNEDETLIRARQGHSIKVDVNLSESTPPDILYHGTATRFLDSILEKGIVKGNRLYVHLSKDEETATTVGARHGKPYVLKIDAKKMYEDGIKFYLSNNNVWLTDFVDAKYIIK